MRSMNGAMSILITKRCRQMIPSVCLPTRDSVLHSGAAGSVEVSGDDEEEHQTEIEDLFGDARIHSGSPVLGYEDEYVYEDDLSRDNSLYDVYGYETSSDVFHQRAGFRHRIYLLPAGARPVRVICTRYPVRLMYRQ